MPPGRGAILVTTSAPATPGPVHDAVSPGRERLHGLDILRGTAMVLGVVLHAAVPYTRFDMPWVYRVRTPNPAYDLTLVAIHSFRMPLFFLVAGFFAHLVQRRLGPTPFLRQRLLRIGVPFLLGMVTLMPWMAFLVLEDQADLEAYHEVHHIVIDADEPLMVWLASLPTFHLWFLEVLLVCYLIVWCSSRLTRGGLSCPAWLDRFLGWAIRSIWPLALLVAPCMVWYADSLPGDGVSFLEYATVIPGGRIVGFCLSFFCMGWWLQGNPSARQDLRARSTRYLIVGTASLLLLLVIRWQLVRNDMQVPHLQHVTGLLAEGSTAWFLSLGFFAWGLRSIDAPPRWTMTLADASYWLYLIHLPLVFQMQILVRSWPLPNAVKFFLCLTTVTAAGLVTYRIVVRDTWLGWVLSGRRGPASRRA